LSGDHDLCSRVRHQVRCRDAGTGYLPGNRVLHDFMLERLGIDDKKAAASAETGVDGCVQIGIRGRYGDLHGFAPWLGCV
jgi:hypothetical protein